MTLLTNAGHMAASHAVGRPALDPGIPLTIAHWRHGDTEVTIGGDDAACLTLVLSETQAVERWGAGAWSHKPSGLGLITVVNPDEPTRFSIRGKAAVAQVFVPLTNLAEASGLEGRPNVMARFLEKDPELERCAQRALVALHEGVGSDPLLLSSIVMRLSGALIEQPARHGSRAVGGLARRQLRRVEELIESRLLGPVASSPSLSQLAAEANLSLHHFAREFRRTTGVTPYAYMLRRRLERARHLVVHSSLPLAQVGLQSGFPSPAHFADRFQREMGVPPSVLRRAAQASHHRLRTGARLH